MKKKLIGALVASALVCVGAFGLFGCGSDDGAADGEFILVEDGMLTIGSDLDYPPMEMLDENGNPDGFAVAMMQEVADRLGLTLNYLPPQNFDSLISQVNAGNTMDVACSSITITDERAELVAFSDSYYDSNQAIVINADSGITDKAQLNDASITVAAQSGTSGEDWIRENLPNAKLITFTATTDAVTALVAGQCSAVVYDQPIAEAHVAGQFNTCTVLEVIATGEQYGLAINKGNTALLAAINAALADMVADGTMDALRAQYLG